MIDLRTKSWLPRSHSRALGKNRPGKNCEVGQRVQGGQCGEAGRECVSTSRTGVRRVSESAWERWPVGSIRELSGAQSVSKAPWLPVEGTVLLSSLPCISCSSQAINNTYPQQPVISLWLLQQVTPQICSVYLNGSMSQMTLVNGPGQSGVL